MKVILETDRLLLREYVEEDAEAFFKLNSDPEVLRFVPDKALESVEQARQILIDHPIADYRKHGFGRGACILKSTGEQIGFAGLKYLEELGEVDVAFRLMRAHWGQGLATEAALASVRYGFDKLRLKSVAGRIRRVRTIIGLVIPENIASVRILEKTGLRYVETVSFWGHQFSKYVIDSQQHRCEC
jgi:ribosomal-protein-alanine N-acetyltransferase